MLLMVEICNEKRCSLSLMSGFMDDVTRRDIRRFNNGKGMSDMWEGTGNRE